MNDDGEAERDDGEREDFELREDKAAGVVAPQWLHDLRRSSHRQGFYRALGNHALVFADRGGDTLVVSFDNLSSARDDVVDRDPWGYGFVAKHGWSQLGVMAFTPDWFRDPTLFEAMQQLAQQGFFQRFRNVTLTGTSMGGYGACAFASLVPGCRVLALSPQSTLRKDLVPWEKRFSSGRKADWSGPFADAAAEISGAAQVWLVHDPLVENDHLHVRRFAGPNVHLLRMRHAGHKTALVLRRAGQLSQVSRDVIEGTMSEARFYATYRENRRSRWFAGAVAERAAWRGRLDLVGRTVRFLRDGGQGFAAHEIRKQYLGGSGHDPLRGADGPDNPAP
ncbi:hypothetical protein [Paracoccus spongiarum]|uniref:Alpha/beta hydrolase n=1 Tax=Paracoccus spongiarum TaxID=3064387 RepID=A0ABT9JBB9_9RHOB|nr:hypothetical protein [Paracoccus sp. 2205BS29-5]MDP5306915.1 hypothetical protein [Paracoccus sp. 2205BS29-5]